MGSHRLWKCHCTNRRRKRTVLKCRVTREQEKSLSLTSFNIPLKTAAGHLLSATMFRPWLNYSKISLFSYTTDECAPSRKCSYKSVTETVRVAIGVLKTCRHACWDKDTFTAFFFKLFDYLSFFNFSASQLFLKYSQRCSGAVHELSSQEIKQGLRESENYSIYSMRINMLH